MFREDLGDDCFMDWDFLIFFIIAGVIGFWFLNRGRGRLSVDALAAKIREGAVVLDVRSKEEFDAGHLDRAIHIPLENVEIEIGNHVKDSNTVLFCHCQSGMRSAVAVGKLKRMGYEAHNLGSFLRARQVDAKV